MCTSSSDLVDIQDRKFELTRRRHHCRACGTFCTLLTLTFKVGFIVALVSLSKKPYPVYVWTSVLSFLTIFLAKKEKICTECFRDQPWNKPAQTATSTTSTTTSTPVTTTTSTNDVAPNRSRADANTEQDNRLKATKAAESVALANLKTAETIVANASANTRRVQDEARSMMDLCASTKREEERLKQEIIRLRSKEEELAEIVAREGEKGRTAERTLQELHQKEAHLRSILTQCQRRLQTLVTLISIMQTQLSLRMFPSEPSLI